MSGGNLRGSISLLYHGCYRSNHDIKIHIPNKIKYKYIYQTKLNINIYLTILNINIYQTKLNINIYQTILNINTYQTKLNM